MDEGLVKNFPRGEDGEVDAALGDDKTHQKIVPPIHQHDADPLLVQMAQLLAVISRHRLRAFQVETAQLLLLPEPRRKLRHAGQTDSLGSANSLHLAECLRRAVAQGQKPQFPAALAEQLLRQNKRTLVDLVTLAVITGLQNDCQKLRVAQSLRPVALTFFIWPAVFRQILDAAAEPSLPTFLLHICRLLLLFRRSGDMPLFPHRCF